MGSLLGRDTNGLPERPLGSHLFSEGLPLAPSCWRENFAEPLYQRIEHPHKQGARAVGEHGTHPEH